MDDLRFPELLTTTRLILRRHETVRAEQMFGLIDADRARLSRHLPWADWSASVEAERLNLMDLRRKWDLAEFFDYAIFRGDSFLGNVGVHSINPVTGTAELGYWLLGPHEGRGFVTEAAGALVNTCFERGLHRLEIRCDPANAKSAAVPRRLGFRLEARLRESAIDAHGQHHDLLVFARLRGDGILTSCPRPMVIRHWGEIGAEPQSFYPNTAEVFGAIARLNPDGSAFEARGLILEPNQRSARPHAVQRGQVFVLVIEGQPSLVWGDEVHHLVAGDVVNLVAGSSTHSFVNDGPSIARLLRVRSAEAVSDPGQTPHHP